jgi:hypothetical protein|tara:strand:+ start:218 stop:406 length:189 start_codon:yes stop_codon:yes gene_type:complete
MYGLKGTRASRADVSMYKGTQHNRASKGQGGGDKSPAAKGFNYPKRGHIHDVDHAFGRKRAK